ncbi:MAG: AHH domain-containing protein, partial [Breznakia sp.]
FHQYVSSCAKAGSVSGMAVGSTAGWMVETAWDAADVVRAVLSKDEVGMAVGLFSLFMSQDDIIKGVEHGLLKGSADDVVKNADNAKPNQVHHYASNKNSTYTEQFDDIAKKYGLDLDSDWNKDLLLHQGRHPNAYHDFVLDKMVKADALANGNVEMFLDLFDESVKIPIIKNPNMLYKVFWNKLPK